MAHIILLTISGEDRVGLSADFYAVIESEDVRILDIGQSVIHKQVSQGMLLQLPSNQDVEQMKHRLVEQAGSLGLTTKIQSISEKDYLRWVEEQGQDRYILTLLAREVAAEEIARITQVTTKHGLNINNISRLSGRVPINQPISNETKSCVQFSLDGSLQAPEEMRASFLKIATELDIDIAIQKDDAFRRNRRLVCFDMDSTLIEAEVIDLLAKKAGCYDEVSRITEAAMRGEVDFKASFKQRLGLLKGLDESVLAEVANELPIMEGAECLIRNLRNYGFKTAIISGGFDYFGKYLQSKFSIDYVFANTLEIQNGKLTGRTIEPIVDAAHKALLLKTLAQQEGIATQQTIAVGDGANDLLMLSAAGLGIAFRAKPLVRESAKQSMSTHGLDSILYLLGYRDQDIQR